MPSRPAQPYLGFAAFTIVAFLLGFTQAAKAQISDPQSRITQPVNKSKVTLLKGNTPPLARAEYDHGAAPASLPMQRMLLVLSRSPQQETALRALLEEQQTKSSPSYHRWLTPAQFGQEFGPSDEDIQTITAWLAAEGFQIDGVSNGRGVIEFSGNAGQVQAAFHTGIHSYVVGGAQHWANAGDPQIPSALVPVVVGVDSLNNFPKRALHHIVGAFTRSKATGRLIPIGEPQSASSTSPLYTYACGNNPNTGAPFYCNGVTPYDFATIYNVLPLWNATTPVNGTGQSIAIVARSNINLQDVSNFQSLFGLPANPPQVILDGPDPGLVSGDETEADIDVEWSGAVAKGATIKLVVSESTEATDGVDLSAEYIVDNDVAPVMSESFGQCELFMGAAGNQFYKELWEQAAAEGISVFVSAGDEGSASCDYFQGTAPQPAKNGLQVSGIASTPFNVAVGGTDFSDFFNPLTYWNLSNNPTTQQSVKGYIPETTWNDSCTNAIFGNPEFGFSTNPETNCNNPELNHYVFAVGGSGGVSNCTNPSSSSPGSCQGGYLKPPWQAGSGIPADNKRDLPDVSLFASNGFANNFYVLCESDVNGGSCNSSSYVTFLGVGGTSVSSPALAGIMALVNQKEGAAQGDPNFVLYKLAGMQTASSCNSSTGPASTCTFNEVTSGTIAMPCATTSPNCTTSNSGDQYGVLSGYSALSGYDLATGLGSVNANNLVSNWGNVKFTPSNTSLTLNGGNSVNITHGSSIPVSVAVTPGSPAPTGDVSLIATQGKNTFGFDAMTLANGSASGSTNMLPGGSSYTVKAHYEGDKNYGGSYSPPVTVMVAPEASQTGLRVLAFDPTSGQLTNPNASTVVYGTPYILRSDVMNSSGKACVNTTSVSQTYACPTGSVAVTDNGSAVTGGPFGLNAEGYTEDQAVQLSGGSHTLVASYSGDNSYNPSSTSEAFTVTPAATTTVISNPPYFPAQSAGIGQQFSFSVATSSQSLGAAPGGTYAVFDGTTKLASTADVTIDSAGSANAGASLQANISTALSGPVGPHTLTVQYSGDANYASSTSASVTINVLYPIAVSATATPDTIIYGSGSTITIVATVDTTNPASNTALKPGGSISFGTQNSILTSPVTITATSDPSGNWELQGSMTFTPQGSELVIAKYSGDSNYQPNLGGGLVFVTVTIPDFSVSAGSAPLVITAGQTGAETLTITPLTSYTSTVQLACGARFNMPGATCSVSPSSVTLSNSAPQTATLTLTTLAPSSTTSAMNIPMIWRIPLTGPFGRGTWWTLSLLAGIGALFLLWLPGRKRFMRTAWVLGIACLLCFAIGCGGGASASNSGGSGGGGGNNAGPTPTTTVLSVPSTRVPASAGITLTATVTSSNGATGYVNFTSSNCSLPLGASNLLIRTAQDVLSPGPIPLPIGTCTITAQYMGDLNNLASQSGPLNIAFTGTNQLQVVAQTSTLTHSIPVNVTLQ